MRDSHATPALHHFPEKGSGGIAVFGVTGATGRVLAELALSRRIPVRALIRPGSGPVPGGADWLIGSLMDHEAVGRVIDGVDAVCCVFGHRPPYRETFTAAATSVIVSCMREVSVARIVCLTGAMIGRYPRNRTILFRLMARVARGRMARAFDDRDRQEAIVTGSGLNWTLVKPPRLTDGAGGRGYRAGPEVRVGLASSVPRRDVAEFILDCAAHGRRFGETIFLKA